MILVAILCFTSLLSPFDLMQILDSDNLEMLLFKHVIMLLNIVCDVGNLVIRWRFTDVVHSYCITVVRASFDEPVFLYILFL